MGWRSEWRAIGHRIDALQSFSVPYFAYVKAREGSDEHGVSNSVMIRTARDIAASIQALHTRHERELPPEAAVLLHKFAEKLSGASGIAGVGLVVIHLAALRAEFDYAVSDATEVPKSLTERAFLHLNRRIVADAPVKLAWQAAFDTGETACERLGGAHLLSHGVWAFKTDAVGARTDLVLGEPLAIGEHERSGVEGLILTEWKKVKDEASAGAARDAAIKQAQRYAEGVLYGFEVSDTRYIVLVSRKRLGLEPRLLADDVSYRVVNIVVDPPVPSKE